MSQTFVSIYPVIIYIYKVIFIQEIKLKFCYVVKEMSGTSTNIIYYVQVIANVQQSENSINLGCLEFRVKRNKVLFNSRDIRRLTSVVVNSKQRYERKNAEGREYLHYLSERRKNKKCAKNIALPASCESNGQTHFPFLGEKMGEQ